MMSPSMRHHQPQENVHARETQVEKFHHSRWISSFRVIVDRPPSQPLSRRQVSGGPNSGSVKESHQDTGAGAKVRQNAFVRLQQSPSKWTICSGVGTDRPPLQPLRCSSSSQTTSIGARGYGVLEENHSLIRMETLVRATRTITLR
jgi:hypothetical protein